MHNQLYLVLHITGLIMVFLGLAGYWAIHADGKVPHESRRKILAHLHGFGLLLLLATGLARLHALGMLHNPPGWVYGKAAVWLALGAGLGLAKTRANLGLKWFAIWIVLGATAAYLALMKPF